MPDNTSLRKTSRSEIVHLVIDSAGVKVVGEDEWHIIEHDKERHRTWRKLSLAVGAKTHEITCSNLSPDNVTEAEVSPKFIRNTHPKISSAKVDGTYDTPLCHNAQWIKSIRALMTRKGAETASYCCESASERE